MIYFPFLGDMDSVSKYLKDNGLQLKERFKIQSHFQQKGRERENKKIILGLMEVMLKDGALEKPSDREVFLEKISEIDVSLWRNFLSFYIAIKGKNMPWALKLKRELSKVSPYVNYVRGISFEEKEEIIVRDFILKVLEDYEDFSDDETGAKILAQNLSELGGSLDFKLIKTRINADWSLAEIRENFKNPRLQFEYFDFWFQLLRNRSSEVEVKKRIRSILSEELILSARAGQFWIFEYFFPGEESLRDALAKRFIEIWKREGILGRFTTVRAVQNDNLKKFLSERNENFKRADFQLQRELYKDILNSGYSTHFALYQLSLLGNKDVEDLWWLMI